MLSKEMFEMYDKNHKQIHEKVDHDIDGIGQLVRESSE